MKTLWCDDISSYEGKYYSLKDAYQNPKPVQKPHPPLLFGGESKAALQRVATVGQGWYGFNLKPGSFEQHLKTLDEMLSDQGRSLEDVSIYLSPSPDATSVADLRAYKDLGAEQIILPVFARDQVKLRERASAVLELVNNAI